MNRAYRGVVSIALLALCSCMSAAQDRSHRSTRDALEQPALLVQVTPRSRASLQAAVAKLLGRESVLLSRNAFTRESTLTIEPKRVRDAQGRVIADRQARTLEHLRLVKSEGRCLLVREGTGERVALTNVECVAVP